MNVQNWLIQDRVSIRLLEMEMTSSNEVPSSGKAFTGFLGRRNSRLSEKGFIVIAFGTPHFGVGFSIQTNYLC